MSEGRLIVFEGPEGVGKTTQIRMLVDALQPHGIAAEVFREPGGTPVGDSIREVVLHADVAISPAAEALLFMASRAELCAHEVRPALDRGAIVILDRFFLSTYAYQIAGRGLDEERVRAANALATGGLVPDLTILLDMPVSAGRERANERSGRDRIERSDDAFYNRVSFAFGLFAQEAWQRARPEAGPVVRVDATGSREDVATRVFAALAERVPDPFSVIAPASAGASR